MSQNNKDDLMKVVLAKLDKIDDKLDKVDNRIDKIDVTLGKQEVQLAEHMRRSQANEEAVAILKDEVKPVVSHVYLMGVLGKIALVLLGSGLILKIVKLVLGV